MKTNSRIQLFPLLRIAAAMAAGVFVGYESYGSMGQTIWLSLAVLSLVLTLLSFSRDTVQGGAVMLTAALLSGYLVTREMDRLSQPLPLGTVEYQAVVASEPQQRGKVIQMDLWIVNGGDAMPRRVKASILRDTTRNQWPDLQIGDGIVVRSQLERPTNYYVSNFDYPLYLRCHGVTATTLVYPDNWRCERLSLESLSYVERTRLAAMKFRHATLQRYLDLGLDDDEMAVAVAMALGDKSRITNDLRDIYSISGASHVLALSGLHLGIIYMLLSLVMGARRLGALRELFIIGGIWAYAVFTGLSPSVVRAALMITIYSLVGLLRRDRMSLNALALTVIIMLATHPLCLYDVGFQMSVMAVLSILVFYKPVYGLVPADYLQTHRIVKWVWAMVVVSCCAQIGVAPLTAYYFGRFSVYFLLTNFVVIPLATIILYLTAAMFVAALVPGLLPIVAKLLSTVVGWQTGVATWVSSLPGSSIENIALNRWQLLLIYVAIAALGVAFLRMLKLRSPGTHQFRS